jgi:ribonuclease HI
LGASVVDPLNNITIYIEIKSQQERHTINRAKLAAITTTLDRYRHAPTLSILTDSAFNINNLNNFSSQSHSFNNHQHKDLLAIADTILRQRDVQGYTTHMGKVKSHIGVEYNDAADEGARNVVEGQKKTDIIFTAADPPIGGLRTWPQTRTTKPDNTTHTTKIADIHNGIRKLLRTQTPQPPAYLTTTYNTILQHAREMGADHNIHAHSNTPFRARRDALEVMWGYMYTSARESTDPPSHAPNATPPLQTHTFSEDAGSQPNSEHKDTTTRSNSYTNYYKKLTGEDVPSSAWT